MALILRRLVLMIVRYVSVVFKGLQLTPFPDSPIRYEHHPTGARYHTLMNLPSPLSLGTTIVPGNSA